MFTVFLFALTVWSGFGEALIPLLAVSNCHSLPASPFTNDEVDTILTQVDIDQLQVAVVLKAPKLSFSDIAKYGEVYGESNENAPLSSLQGLLSSSVSSFSAGVSGQPAADLTSTLRFAMDTTPLVLRDVSELRPKGNGRHLMVIELPEANDEDTFRVHDAAIAKVKTLMDQSSTKYVIFYTSDHSGIVKSPQKRSTPQKYTQYTQDSHTTSPLCYQVKDDYNYSSCIVFCFTSTSVVYTSENTSILLGNTEDGIRYERGSCNSTESLPEEFQTNNSFAFIMFKVYGNGTDEKGKQLKKTLVFTFENGTCDTDSAEDNGIGCGFWTMNLFAGKAPHEVVKYQRNKADENIYTKFSIPHSASYACGDCSLNKFVSVSADESNDTYQLTGIQVQAFSKLGVSDDNELVFDSAYHCQGYFDSTLWMGVVSVLLLLFVLYVSYIAAFSLQSPDTFDDPRAPTITVDTLH